MQRILFLLIGIFTLSSCGTTTTQVIESKELKYKKVLIVPFTEGGEPWPRLAYDTFTAGMMGFKDIEVLREEKLPAEFISELHLNHTTNLGPLDFSGHPEGDDRRRKLTEQLGIDAVIFGSLFKDGDHVSLHIQMLDLESSALTLRLSREETVVAGKTEEAVENLAQTAYLKVISHIKENYSGTILYRYN